jgi:hypothetical protein
MRRLGVTAARVGGTLRTLPLQRTRQNACPARFGRAKDKRQPTLRMSVRFLCIANLREVEQDADDAPTAALAILLGIKVPSEYLDLLEPGRANMRRERVRRSRGIEIGTPRIRGFYA